MAKPPNTVSEIIAVAHGANVGNRRNGYRVVSRTDRRTGLSRVVVRKQRQNWTVDYMETSSGGEGRVMQITDADRRHWFPRSDRRAWDDGGVR